MVFHENEETVFRYWNARLDQAAAVARNATLSCGTLRRYASGPAREGEGRCTSAAAGLARSPSRRSPMLYSLYQYGPPLQLSVYTKTIAGGP